MHTTHESKKQTETLHMSKSDLKQHLMKLIKT